MDTPPPSIPGSAPKLSIITVNLNNAAGLARTLASVHEEQSFQPMEHIVVDGGSTDGSLEVIHRHEHRLARWVSEPDAGIFPAMNKGLAWARGEYLLFLNSGDWLVPDVLQSVFSDFPAADIVYGDLQFMVNDRPGQLWVPCEAGEINFMFWVRGSLPHGATFIRRGLMADRGYAEEYRIIADREFFFRTFMAGSATFAHMHRQVGYFSRGGTSNDPRNARQRQEEVTRLFEPYMRRFELMRLVRDERLLESIIRKRHDRIQESEPLREELCRWIDLFFWLYRFRFTRSGLGLGARLLQHMEARRLSRQSPVIPPVPPR